MPLQLLALNLGFRVYHSTLRQFVPRMAPRISFDSAPIRALYQGAPPVVPLQFLVLNLRLRVYHSTLRQFVPCIRARLQPCRSGRKESRALAPVFRPQRAEVTNAQYARFCQERGRPLPEGFPADRPDYPVVNITYVDADLYAKWAGKRLPTMDEWEKAARGDNGRPYPWGQDADAAKAVTQARELAPAGSIPSGASPYGALDMIGSVWEFVNDPRTPTPGALNAFRS